MCARERLGLCGSLRSRTEEQRKAAAAGEQHRAGKKFTKQLQGSDPVHREELHWHSMRFIPEQRCFQLAQLFPQLCL